MARAAATKLLLLVFLAFIICLPELFRIYSVSKVNFHCLPHQPHEPMHQERKGGNVQPINGKAERKAICNPTSRPELEQLKQICAQEAERNAAELHPETQKVQGDSRSDLFMCETDKNMEELHSNLSSPALVVLLEVSAVFQVDDGEAVNRTLYGYSSQRSLFLRPPEEEEVPTGDKANQGQAFYCCLPLIQSSNSTNQSHCLLWIANQTVLTGNKTERLSWKQADKGWCNYRWAFMVLLCVVCLIVVTTVITKICLETRLNNKNIVHHIEYQPPNQQLKETASRLNRHQSWPETRYHLNRVQSWAGLPPILEIESRENIETLLNGNPLSCYPENPSSSLPSSYLLPHRRTAVLTDVQQKEHRNCLKAH
ncbi:uncharacterized protein LOC103137923 isoform X2 [Poecilia formosa]|uniref:uncharacterized protein LOC103137923 isoform X2 n=1 Tax=Poecilia formosa TaxID=48698 RepID=UPI000443F23D|nr:PREDICTED: uncharacterized protein LOC103137923 isoform X2 [Poecilia formosa]